MSYLLSFPVIKSLLRYSFRTLFYLSSVDVINDSPRLFSSTAPCPNGHLRGGGAAPLLQQEQNRGAVTNREVLLLSGTSGRDHQSRPVVCRWYAPTTITNPVFKCTNLFDEVITKGRLTDTHNLL